MRVALSYLCLCLFAFPALGQELRLPRTIKLYPLTLVSSELSVGYEHGVKPQLSISGRVGLHGSGNYSQSQIRGSLSSASQCVAIWPDARGFSVKGGVRYYPSKKRRSSPFYVEGLLSYRRTVFPRIREFPNYPCIETTHPSKEISPVVQRFGFLALVGGALRRDKRFTLDMFGGIGFHNEVVDERQRVDPGFPDGFYRIEPVSHRFKMSVHLNLSIGYNLHGGRKS
jgi:hypothetical protein